MKRFIMGELKSNAFLFPITLNEAVLFDCGGLDIEELKNYIKSKNYILKALILTHGHIDHIRGVNLLMEEYPDLILYIGEEEKDFLENSEYNLSYMIYRELYKVKYLSRVKYVKERENIYNFKVIDTPGHTIGGKSYYNKDEKVVVTGDTMFKGGSIGRTDFPTGNIEELMKSIKKLCNNLPEDTIICSGHGEESTIGEEKNIHLGDYFGF